MAVLFSNVIAKANDQSVSFLVIGCPCSFEELEGWRIFDDFLSEIEAKTEVFVHAENYVYGEGTHFIATPEEVAYFHLRREQTPDFLETRCSKVGDNDFSFTWDPGELFEMEMR